LKAFDVYPLKSAEKGHSTIVQPLSTATAVFTLVIRYSWNGFQIIPSYDNNQIKQQIIGDLIKLQQ